MKLPAPTAGKLAAAFGTNDLSLTLGTGEGALYDATGYIRVKDQIIRYTSNVGDVLSWPDSTYRSQFGTTAAAGDIGDVVQQCPVYVDQPFADVVRNICNLSGIADGNIDVTGIEAEDDTWLGLRYHVTACLHEPESASTYLTELAQQTGGVIWWDPVAAKVKYRFIGPQSPAALTGATLDDEANLVLGSVDVAPLDDLRLTRAYLGFNTVTARRTSPREELPRGRGYIDSGAERPRVRRRPLPDVMYSRWFTSGSESGATAFVKRRVGQYRDAPKNITCKVDAKDADIEIGDLYDVTTAQLVDATGAATSVRTVVKPQDNGRGLDITLRTTNFGRRYGFIAPNGTGDYPNNATATPAPASTPASSRTDRPATSSSDGEKNATPAGVTRSPQSPHDDLPSRRPSTSRARPFPSRIAARIAARRAITSTASSTRCRRLRRMPSRSSVVTASAAHIVARRCIAIEVEP